MANLSLEHGNSDGSCYRLCLVLGMILGPRFGDYQAGFRFGKLGCDWWRSADWIASRPASTCLRQSRHSLDEAHPHRPRLVRRAFDTANRSGDLTYAVYSCNNLITNLLTGEPLDEVQREAEKALALRAQGAVWSRMSTIIPTARC